jgi:NAD(P)-dependent dehydrogenase (short-subunit alcohol dehydrogenase family)
MTNPHAHPFRADLFSGKRVLVTGGGTGLGRAVAHRVAQLGGRVVICGRREDVLQASAAEMSKATEAQVLALTCDIRDPQAIEAMYEAIWKEGPLDILVNNASANFLSRTETLSPRAFTALTDIALHGNAYCALGVGRRWIAENRPGVILNVLTAGAVNGRAFTVPLTMSKAAMLAMTKSLAVEWGPKGIRSVAIAPGLFPTPGAWQQLFDQRKAGADPTQAIPLQRFGEHDEFADACCFLISDAAGYINGDMITIDGGRALKGMDVDDLLAWSDEQWDSLKAGRKR